MRLERTIVIERPPAEVFAFVADPRNLPVWQPSVLEVRVPDGPVRLGSVFAEKRHLGPFHATATVEVTGLEPKRSFNLRATGGPIPVDIDHTFEDVGGSTRLTIAAEGRPRGPMRFAAATIARTVEHAVEGDLARLKLLLEREPRPAS
jgi:carbon monoxide dehydrogenase subunit G